MKKIFITLFLIIGTAHISAQELKVSAQLKPQIGRAHV